jgi:hypothetical protein
MFYQPKVFSLPITLALLVAFVAVALPDRTSAVNNQQRRDDCSEAAELRVLLSRDLTTLPFPRVPTTISGTKSALVKTTCPDHRHLDKPLPSFAWKLEAPLGSASRLENTNTLSVTFTPDRFGQYVVKLIACPNVCTLRLLSGQTSTGKPLFENTPVGPVERTLIIDVAEDQLPPLYTPAALPSLSSPTQPEHYGEPRSHCSNDFGIGIGEDPQWVTTKAFDANATPPYELVEGRVYHTLVSRKDHPASHHSNDTDAFVELDPPFRRLLVDDTAEDKGRLLPFGGLEIEWEEREWPEAFRPVAGDRISALGFHVIDCGHEKYTELHPPIAVAVHRPAAVELPGVVKIQDDKPPQPTGTNVVVPGIVTDLWASLRGGQALDCQQASVHQPVFTTLPNGSRIHNTCVKQPTAAGVNFDFNIFLPENPEDRLKERGLKLKVRPALFFDIQNHPDAAALGARSDIQPFVLEKHLEGPTPFIKVRLPLSRMSTGQKFAKRIVAAWVYPDHTSHNFGLRALRVKLDQLVVTDDGDPFSKGDGDWKLWAVIPSLARPWTRLIDCDGCVSEKTFTPGSSIFRSGALDGEGALTGEVLLFDRQLGALQLTGYEEDLLTSDDVGNVFEIINTAPATRNVISKCNDQTVGGLNDLDPSSSSCAGYTVKFEYVAGRHPLTATFSPEMKKLADDFVVRAEDQKRVPDVPDTELFTLDRAIDERTRLIVGRRGDVDPWQEAVTTAQLGKAMRAGNPEPMLKDLRQHVQALLGPRPTPKHRRKVALELQELKKSVPPGLYKKFLCDLETGKPCK